ncbi:protein N-terminal asparagine amidohydrolase-like [Asterias rubens]|uniref:protein N-terminal asparagine amidohydrolase-like n=1 Tax=Asterias rubens TaxID=7604 RepID=UPI001455685D|nr:protein N-terminal asparagine amidohydrolase-like [Asterias rubens]XP_033647007.1 protein N-terminal asparagine amidohydrolase-like [Asterias rubens]
MMPVVYSDGTFMEDTIDLQASVYSKFEDSSKAFHSLPLKPCPPKGLLYVDQREFAVTTVSDDVIDTLGSDDATTCHIVVLRHSGTGVTGLCHFDGCNTRQGVEDLVESVLKLGNDGGSLELHVVGGFQDDKETSEKLSRELLSEFHKLEVDVYLMTACISGLNNTVKNGINYPIVYGIAVSVKTGAIFPASFEYKGPDKALRSLRHFIGDTDVKNIYDGTSHRLVIGPYNYGDFPNAWILMQQSDSTLRKYLSTSPAVEPEYFEQSVRAALGFYLSNPDAASVFPDGQPHAFTMTPDGQWSAVTP